MNNKENIILHINGVDAFKRNEFSLAASTFQKIDAPSSYIIYNIGCCYLNENKYELAENCFLVCIQKDKYNSAGFFQLAAVQCLIKRFSDAGENFKKCLKALRGNDFIDYKQLNMKARLYAWQVQFNLGLLYMFSGDGDTAFGYFREAGCLYKGSGINNPISFALKAFQTKDFSYFGDSIVHRLITLPKTAVFAPSKAKREGVEGNPLIKTGVSQVVSAVNQEYDFIGFVGPEKLKRQMVDKNDNKSNKSEITLKKNEDSSLSLIPPTMFSPKVSAFKPPSNISSPNSPRNLPLPPVSSTSRPSSPRNLPLPPVSSTSRPSSPRNLPLPPVSSTSRPSSQVDILPPLPPKTVSKSSSSTNLSTFATLPPSAKPKSKSSSPVPSSSHQLIPTSRPSSSSFSISLPPPPSHAPPPKPSAFNNSPSRSVPELTLFTDHPYLKPCKPVPKVIKTNHEIKSFPVLLQLSLNFNENQITSYENFIKALSAQLQTTTSRLMNGDNLNMQLNFDTSGLNSQSWSKKLVSTEQINILHLKPTRM